MKSFFSPPAGGTKPEIKLADDDPAVPSFSLPQLSELPPAKPEAEAAPGKKRRVFLSAGFFGGRDKELSSGSEDENFSTSEALTEPVENGEAEAGGEPPVSASTPPEGPAASACEPSPAADPRMTLPIPFINQPRPIMTTTDTTTSPDTGRASAQLTLSFEITSLQLTPSFKLGSVQLKAVSNVVSLHLIAAQQTDNPLAAGISFQIEHVNLDAALRLKSLLLKPLGESREMAPPQPKLQIDSVAVAGGDSPISVVTAGQGAAAVQLFGTFAIAAMDFTPSFEIGSLRLEPTSNTVLLRVVPSAQPATLDLPPAFEIAEVQIADGEQIAGVRVVPAAAKNI